MVPAFFETKDCGLSWEIKNCATHMGERIGVVLSLLMERA